MTTENTTTPPPDTTTTPPPVKQDDVSRVLIGFEKRLENVEQKVGGVLDFLNPDKSNKNAIKQYWDL